MSRLAGLLVPLLLLVPAPFVSTTVLAQPAPDREPVSDRAAVRQAALDYVEALYQVDTTRVARSVHPELVKYGYYTRDGAYRGTPMTYEELKGLAARWNKDQGRVDPDTARKDVAVFEVLDKTASARVTAHWGRDYMHLVKTGDGWKIRQILWQSHPPKK